MLWHPPAQDEVESSLGGGAHGEEPPEQELQGRVGAGHPAQVGRHRHPHLEQPDGALEPDKLPGLWDARREAADASFQAALKARQSLRLWMAAGVAGGNLPSQEHD